MQVNMGWVYVFCCLVVLSSAIPWPFTFGSRHALDSNTGRIAELDSLLKRNSESLADVEQRRHVISQALIVAEHHKTDLISKSYYTSLLTQIQQKGFSVLLAEDQRINRALAKVMFKRSDAEFQDKVLKERHILDVFYDVASEYVWPELHKTVPRRHEEL